MRCLTGHKGLELLKEATHSRGVSAVMNQRQALPEGCKLQTRVTSLMFT
jgi:hypothetical protein